jgi:hypothetical protein
VEKNVQSIFDVAKKDPERAERVLSENPVASDYAISIPAGAVTYVVVQHTVIAAVRTNDAGEMSVSDGCFCAVPSFPAFLDVELGEAIRDRLTDPTARPILDFDERRHDQIARRMYQANMNDDFERGALWPDVISDLLAMRVRELGLAGEDA